MKLIAQRLKEIRVFRGFQSKELAQRAGISAAEVSLIEKNRRKMPQVDTLQKLAAALEVTTSYLLGEVDGEVPLRNGLARQSLNLYLRSARVPPEEVAILKRLAELESAPTTGKEWERLVQNVQFYNSVSARE